MMHYMYITVDPTVASIAQKAGVDRIFIDLETLGKQERQGHIDTVKSFHRLSDITNIRSVIDGFKGKKSDLLVRINPIHNNIVIENISDKLHDSAYEIDAAIANGADILMLPMWKNAAEVRRFVELVNGRVRTMLLLETHEARACLREVLKIPGIDEVHIGLNDLHLCYGKTFMFEMLTDGTVDEICSELRKTNVIYGFGGIARLGTGALPAELILAEHYRLGSQNVILSRNFCNPLEFLLGDCSYDTAALSDYFIEGVAALRDYERQMQQKDSAFFIENRSTVSDKVRLIVEQTREN